MNKNFDTLAWNPETNSYVDAKNADGRWWSDDLPDFLQERRDNETIRTAAEEVESAKPYPVEWWVSDPEQAAWLEAFFKKHGIPIDVVPFVQP